MVKLMLLILTLIIVGCSTDNNPITTNVEDTTSTQKSYNVDVILSDYTSGVMLNYNLSDSISKHESTIKLSGDASGFKYGDKNYILNRTMGKNASIMILKDGVVSLEKSINYQNPHSISFLNDSIAYVTLYNANKILKINSNTLDSIGIINLPTPADTSAPSPDQSVIINNKLYVALQFQKNWSPSQNGQIVIIDTKTDAIVDSITLLAQNPTSKLLNYNDSTIIVSCVGTYFSATDGAIQVVNLNSKKVSVLVDNTLLNGSDVSSSISLYGDALYFQYGSYGANKLAKIDIPTKKLTLIETSKGVVDFTIESSYLCIGLATYDATTYSYFQPEIDIKSILNDSLIYSDTTLLMPVYGFIK